MTATDLDAAVCVIESNDGIGSSDDMEHTTIHYLNDHFCRDELDEQLRISTMSITFRVTEEPLDLSLIAKECPLEENGVQFINYQQEYRSISGRPMPRKNRKHNNFFNSMTLGIAADDKTDRPIHFKLFKNGSVQCAGCRSVEAGNMAIHHLICALMTLFAPTVSKLKINLINANFKLGFRVNRDKLYRLFVTLEFSATYEKCKHAGVGVKFSPSGKDTPISLFIFESGSVVITGSKTESHIKEGFDFMKAFAREHRTTIQQYQNSVQAAMANPKYAALMMSPRG